MKITPDNFAAVFEYMVGEPGPADFHDSLTEMHACRCDNCGTWWCDSETLVAGDFSNEDLCIECWEGFSDVWCEGISAREHEAASAAKERLWDAVEFRTLDEALADQRAADGVAEFQTILNIIGHRLNREAPSLGQRLFNVHRQPPEDVFLLARQLDGFAERSPDFRCDVADAKHCLDAIVMLRAA